jgi:Flp pilus assembly protein TadD
MTLAALTALMLASAEPTLPDHPEVDVAKAAYNGKRYNEASRRFLLLVQRWPTNAALYRALGRSRNFADDPAGAAAAYGFYLDLAKDAADHAKVESELELVTRKAGGDVQLGPPAEAASMLEGARARAATGRFVGEEGAYGSIDAALQAGYIGPRLAQVRRDVAVELTRLSNEAIERWWLPDARVAEKDLNELDTGWANQTSRRDLTVDERSTSAAIRGLSLLRSKQPAAALAALAPVATQMAPLRFAQALALVHANRDAEALTVLEAMRGAVDDRRVDLLRGLVLTRMGRADRGARALKEAME